VSHATIGFILVFLGSWGLISWWGQFGTVARGSIPFLLLVGGLVAILSGYRSNSRSRER
jgi:hypothetical protein